MIAQPPVLKSSSGPRLLTAAEVMRRLGLSKTKFYGLPSMGRPGLRARLIAKGLKVVRVPSVMGNRVAIRYTAESVDKLIQMAALDGSLLC